MLNQHFMGNRPQNTRMSPAIWDHTWTWPALTPAKLVLNLPTPEGWKVELTSAPWQCTRLLVISALSVMYRLSARTHRDNVCCLIGLKQLQLVEWFEQSLRVVIVDEIQARVLWRSEHTCIAQIIILIVIITVVTCRRYCNQARCSYLLEVLQSGTLFLPAGGIAIRHVVLTCRRYCNQAHCSYLPEVLQSGMLFLPARGIAIRHVVLTCWRYCNQARCSYLTEVLQLKMFVSTFVKLVGISQKVKVTESCAIAKMTVQCALHTGALNIFGTPWLRPRPLFPTFSWTFVLIDTMNVPAKLEVALPFPGIIGGTQNIWAVPGYAHAACSPKVLMGFY